MLLAVGGAVGAVRLAGGSSGTSNGPVARPVTSADPSLGAASSPAASPSASAPAEPLVATGRRVYVDCRSGDDGGDGSSTRPWRSLDPARQLDNDTAVFLRRGCSWDGGLKLVADRISLGAYGSGDAPVITGVGLDRQFPVLDVESDGAMLSGLQVRRGAAVGVEIAAPDVRVDDLELSDVAFGISVKGPRATINRTRAHDLHMLVNTPGGSDDTGAVGFDVQADDVTITGSSCTNCRAPSYDFGYDGGFAEIYNHGNRLKLLGNTATNVQGILEIGGTAKDGSADQVLVQGNTFRETYGGVWIHRGDEFSIPVGRVTLQGNTIANTHKGIIMGGGVGSLVVQDNTIAVPGQVSTGGAPGTHTGNHYYLSRDNLLGFRPDPSETVDAFDAYPN